MQENRITYFYFSLITLVLGIASRIFSGIPLFFGDILYAVLIYFGLRFLFLLSKKITVFYSLIFCFAIEFSQLINWNWLNTIRKTTLGHYVLGEGFLVSDLICYSIGVSIAFILDMKFSNTNFS